MSASDLLDGVMAAVVSSPLGEAAEYRPTSGSSYDFRGVFSDVAQSVEVGDGGTTEIVSARPKLGVRLSDFSDGHPKQGDSVYIMRLDQEYRIEKIVRDGGAGADLILRKE